jgi:ribosomal protein S18 acetylase RimI-like enzyme
MRLGLGPSFLPRSAMRQLKVLLDQNCFWAKERDIKSLKQMLRGSDIAVSAWRNCQLVGFGRATSDGIYRAVLWDVVVARAEEGQGLGTRIVTTLLRSRRLRECERVYLMTSQSKGFYERLGFQEVESQHLLLRSRSFQSGCVQSEY